MMLHVNLPEYHAYPDYDALSCALAQSTSRLEMTPLTGFPQTPSIPYYSHVSLSQFFQPLSHALLPLFIAFL